MDEGLLRKVLLGISCRDYETAAEAVPGAIGLSKSQVSRELKKASTAKLKEFQKRELSHHDVMTLFLDGKTFANDSVVIALGVTMEGDTVFLGFMQTETENTAVTTSYLPRTEQKRWRQRMQQAYQRPTYEETNRDLKKIRWELNEVNQSAVASLDEGFEESLTLHRLGVFPLVGRLRRLLGYRHLPMLRAAIQKELGITHPDSIVHSVS